MGRRGAIDGLDARGALLGDAQPEKVEALAARMKELHEEIQRNNRPRWGDQ